MGHKESVSVSIVSDRNDSNKMAIFSIFLEIVKVIVGIIYSFFGSIFLGGMIIID